MFDCSVVYHANFTATEDIVVNQGGTYSGKTYSIMQVLFSIAISTENATISIVGQDVPNLKRGALKDAETIIASSPILKSFITSYNGTDRIFKFSSGSKMEFVSYQNAQDAHSGKREYLFVNECNGINWAIIEQLVNRTNVRTFLDYNPSSEFWAHEKLIYPKKFGNKSVKLIISDHRHNPFISEDMHQHIELRMVEDPEWGKVYGRGMTGKIEGLIFRDYRTVDEIPKDAKLIGYGLDFGYSNDPTAMVAVYLQNGELFIKEMIYQTKLTNDDISKLMESLGISKRDDIIADSAEPKSIEELYRLGWNVYGAEKGQDSIRNSIDILKRYKLNVLTDSANLRKEMNRYQWAVDKNGNALDKPVDFLNHATDALRYVALNLLSKSIGWSSTFR